MFFGIIATGASWMTFGLVVAAILISKPTVPDWAPLLITGSLTSAIASSVYLGVAGG